MNYFTGFQEDTGDNTIRYYDFTIMYHVDGFKMHLPINHFFKIVSDFTKFENKFYSINHKEEMYLPLVLKDRIHILISVLKKDYKCQYETKLDEST